MFEKEKHLAKPNIEVLKNLDFLTRTGQNRKLLFSSEFHEEDRREIALDLARLLKKFYGRDCAVVDLGDEEKNFKTEVEYHRARDYEWLMSAEEINFRKLDTHLKNLEERFDLTFVIQDVKRNSRSSMIPEVELDGAVLIRSDRSIGPSKSRHSTQLIQDANLPILGIIYNRKS